MAIPTDALILQNPLSYRVDSSGNIQVENTDGTFESVSPVQLIFKVEGYMGCGVVLNNKEFSLVDEKRFIVAKVNGDWHYCKTITDSELSGFKRLEYYDGNSIQIKDDDIDEICEKKLVETDVMVSCKRKKQFFLLEGNCVISNGIVGANYKKGIGTFGDRISFDCACLENPNSLIHGKFDRY